MSGKNNKVIEDYFTTSKTTKTKLTPPSKKRKSETKEPPKKKKKPNRGSITPAKNFRGLVSLFNAVESSYTYESAQKYLGNQDKQRLRKGSKLNSTFPPDDGSGTSYLRQQLSAVLEKVPSEKVSPLFGGKSCIIVKVRERKIPETILKYIYGFKTDLDKSFITTDDGDMKPVVNVTLHWVASYLGKVFPARVDGWEKFSCSHKCLSGLGPTPKEVNEKNERAQYCLEPTHMVWESHSDNTSRGYRVCRRVCSHCAEMLCVCQSIHNPPCI